MTRWKMQDLKDNNIHLNQEGVGKKLITTPSKKPSEEQIKKELYNLKKNHDKNLHVIYYFINLHFYW